MSDLLLTAGMIVPAALGMNNSGPNVVYELGMMHLLKPPCVILKHAALPKMPTDLLSMLYEDYANRNEAVQKLGEWWTKTNA